MCSCSIGKNNLGSKKEQEIRQQYQDKLNRMENELKQLKAALKQHQHVVKSKVQCSIFYLYKNSLAVKKVYSPRMPE